MIKKIIMGLMAIFSFSVNGESTYSLREDQFKKDFLVYIKFLQELSTEELFSPLVLEDIASLYRGGHFYNDTDMNHSISNLMSVLAAKAAKKGVSHGARQFAADIVADYALKGRDHNESIHLQQLVRKISLTHQHEEEVRIAQHEEKMRAEYIKRKEKEEQQEMRDYKKRQADAEKEEEPSLYKDERVAIKSVVSKKPKIVRPKKILSKKNTSKKSETVAKKNIQEPISFSALSSQVPETLSLIPDLQSSEGLIPARAKRGRPKKETSAISLDNEHSRKSKKVLSVPKIATTPKRVRKKSS